VLYLQNVEQIEQSDEKETVRRERNTCIQIIIFILRQLGKKEKGREKKGKRAAFAEYTSSVYIVSNDYTRTSKHEMHLRCIAHTRYPENSMRHD